jgi:threonyl-tRNA synthetase
MSEITVTLPDGSRKQVPAGTTPLEIAESIGRRLADDAVAARVNGDLHDLTRPLEADTTLQILTSRDPEALDVYRHSAAHLLAAAVLDLYPGTKLGIGPAIENGFYYDFERDEKFTPEDLEKIEARMWELQKQGIPYVRTVSTKDEGLRKYREMGEHLKCELIDERAGAEFSEYKLGDHLVDFCRGPHVPSTKRIKAFKLLSIAGAYWKGDENNLQMQRIYGTAFFSKKDLEAYLQQLEEAKRRDHRRLGKELDLFSIQELGGPGLAFFHPKGGMIRKLMEDWMRDEYLARGYSLVYTPHIARSDLWHTSGHYEHYVVDMFKRMEMEDADYQLKPMNCPFHILIYKDRMRSYRDLPIRMGELGTVYRHERSGVTHGLFRVRGFTQDDAHIFCTAEQIEDEVVGCLEFALHVLKTFGFSEYTAELSTWEPDDQEKYMGTPEQWKLAEDALQKACTRVGLAPKHVPGEAAFYGPKIDVKLVDAIGRTWQLSTIQFDFNMPKRFEMEYIAEDGKAHQPLMVHRALFGSVERFFGILTEHYAGAFPMWLAPVQAMVLPITDRTLDYAHQVARQLTEAGLRVEVDDRKEKVNFKIREAQLQKVPYMLVVGDREAEAGKVAVRNRKHGDQGAQTVTEFLAKAQKLIDSKAPAE